MDCLLECENFYLIVLDLMLLGEDGFLICCCLC